MRDKTKACYTCVQASPVKKKPAGAKGLPKHYRQCAVDGSVHRFSDSCGDHLFPLEQHKLPV